jgi:hypothetical protein
VNEASSSVDWIELAIGGAIGFVAAFALLILVEALRSPKLEFRPDTAEPGPVTYADGRTHDARFLHVEIRNKRRRWFSRFRDQTAVLFTTHIHFYDTDGQLLIEPVPARWPTSEPEPGSVQAATWIHREFIPSGGVSAVDVAVKFSGEPGCWGYNNRSYLRSYRWPAYQLDKTLCLVRVQISAQESTYYSPWYRVRNPSSSLEDFVLEGRRDPEWWEHDRVRVDWSRNPSWQSSKRAIDSMQPF